MAEDLKVGVGVGVMVLNSKGEVLLGQRHPDRDKARSALRGEGTWTMPGGKVHFGESFEQAAARELLEEAGVTVAPENFKLVSLSQDISEHAHFITAGLLLEDFSGKPEVKEPDVITCWKWFSLDILPHPLYFPSERVISNFKSKSVYDSTKTVGHHS